MCRLFPLSSHRLLLLLRVSKHRQTLKVIVDNIYILTIMTFLLLLTLMLKARPNTLNITTLTLTQLIFRSGGHQFYPRRFGPSKYFHKRPGHTGHQATEHRGKPSKAGYNRINRRDCRNQCFLSGQSQPGWRKDCQEKKCWWRS